LSLVVDYIEEIWVRTGEALLSREHRVILAHRTVRHTLHAGPNPRVWPVPKRATPHALSLRSSIQLQ
jgi:hypothetical protein